jgi:hypothetical protein
MAEEQTLSHHKRPLVGCGRPFELLVNKDAERESLLKEAIRYEQARSLLMAERARSRKTTAPRQSVQPQKMQLLAAEIGKPGRGGYCPPESGKGGKTKGKTKVK